GLEIPMDVLAQRAEVELTDPLPPLPAPTIAPHQAKEAAQMLVAAKHPLLIVGGGAMDAGAEIREIAERLQAPVILSYSGKGAIDERHPLVVNNPTGHLLWGDADLVLAVGTRLQAQHVNWGIDERLKLIRVDIDPAEINRVRRPSLGIVGDARPVLAAIAGALASLAAARPSRAEEVASAKAAIAAELATLSPQVEFAAAIRAALPEDGIYVDELTQVAYVARVTLPVHRPRTYIDSGYQGTLGYGFPTALGAKVAFPDRPVLSVSGDGGFMYAAPELATAVRHNIGVVAVVFSDDAYGNVRRMQRMDYDGKIIGSDLTNPDFAALAEVHGATGVRAKTPRELQDAITAALKRPGPTVIAVPVGEMPNPWKIVYRGRARPKA
ncbi:MAG TPA: thiamine pyrophosphate-dependent enzyme, partial [Stellaceae bacterium]|nr:thiamine pyrophosphate-dependent enzyme [Stellaceae bacterium]